ncbi:MAG: hypothetical protein IT355_13440 [Gemmatimonadaceae bacterium]|nr:hypothetical protein [Gemmatimonadaceae bacterium]
MTRTALSHHRPPPRWRARCVMLAVWVLIAMPTGAQRPAPPRGWTIDTTGGVPVAVRRGGMLSTDTKAELLGPVLREGPALQIWISTFARSNAATLGTVDSGVKDEIAVGTIAGQRVVTAAQTVRTQSGTKYVAYGILQDTPTGAPVIVVRSIFGDALTLARVFRSSVEALMPYVLAPMESMRVQRSVAMAAQPVTSFRGLASATPPPADTAVPVAAATAPAATGDSAGRAAIGAAITDAVAELEPTPAAATAGPARSPATAGRARGTRTGSATTPTVATGALAASLVKVVFYQFGDLQFHPVALFRDGTSFDVSDVPLEQTDARASRAAQPRRWGRWRNEGQTYYLSGQGEKERDYTLGGGGFHTAFAAPPGTTLDGTYKAVSGMTMGETNTLSTTQLRFAPDGRFTGANEFAAIGSGETSGVSTAAGASSSNAGRYRVTGHRLVLTYDSGEVKEFFFAFGSGGDTEAIDRDMMFVGSTAFVR